MSYLDLFKRMSKNNFENEADKDISIKVRNAQKQFDRYFKTAPNKFKIERISEDIIKEPINYSFDGVIQSIRHGEEDGDSKLLIVQNDTKLSVGDEVFWDNESWIIINKEHRSVQTHQTFTITLCNSCIKFRTSDNSLYAQNVIIENLRNKAYSMQETYDKMRHLIAILSTNFVNHFTQWVCILRISKYSK